MRWGLLAVAQCGVEYDDAVVCVHNGFAQVELLFYKSIQIQIFTLRLCQFCELL